MNALVEVPVTHPMREQWEDYKISFEYSQTRKWAQSEAQTDASLWTAFTEGWRRAIVTNPKAVAKLPEVLYDSVRVQRHMKERGYNVDLGTVSKILDAVVAIYDIDQAAKS